MNIFRVLAQGDGNINEPNVSAFLGYLLNPGEDHGLDSLFLEEFLKQHYQFCKCFQENIEGNIAIKKKGSKEMSDPFDWLNDDFRTSSKYEVKVFFEQAFKKLLTTDAKTKNETEKNKKDIVDIILVIYEVGDKNDQIEKKFENYISEKRKLKHIFLIEVKIKDSACILPKDNKEDQKNKEGQLENQIIKGKDLIESIIAKNDITDTDFDKKISAIFVTPGQNKCNKAKKAFSMSFNHPEIKLVPKSHIFWNLPNDANVGVLKKSFKNGKLTEDYITFHDLEEENQLEDGAYNPKSIEVILDSLIYPDNDAKQQPIPLNTLDTIKSFSNYLYSDFSYKIKKPKGNSKRDVFKKFDQLKLNYPKTIDKNSWEELKVFNDYIIVNYPELGLEFSRGHLISIFNSLDCTKGTKIFSFSTNLKNIHLILNNHEILEKNRESLKTLFSKFKYNIIADKDDFGLELKAKEPNIEDAIKIFKTAYQILSSK